MTSSEVGGEVGPENKAGSSSPLFSHSLTQAWHMFVTKYLLSEKLRTVSFKSLGIFFQYHFIF